MRRNNIQVLIFVLLIMFFSPNLFCAESDTHPFLPVSKAYVDYQVKRYQYNSNVMAHSEKLYAQKEAYNQEIITHHKHLMKIAEDSFKMQQIMSVVISAVILVIVLMGLWLSYLQFKADSTLNVPKRVPEGGAQSNSVLKISKEGVEFSSSVIGLIILFMSFFFFYLFLDKVYTISRESVKPLSFDNGFSAYDKNQSSEKPAKD